MAKIEHDREDLIAEAVALVERVELAVPHEHELVVVGFRENGCGCIYFGPQPVYQFNSLGQFRRAFVEDVKITAQAGRLASLHRRVQDGQVQMVRHNFTVDETQAFLTTMVNRLTSLCNQIASGEVTVTRQIPSDIDLLARVNEWLELLRTAITIAKQPNAV